MKRKISIVVPLYNEQENVEKLVSEISHISTLCSNFNFEIVAVNDGSSDETLSVLASTHIEKISLKVIDLSRNFGKEAALSAGIFHADGDAVIPLDADMQDPPSLIPEMIALWERGYEVVVAKRSDRSEDTYIKRTTAEIFYKFINKLSETEIPKNVGDFRLMDKKVVEVLKSLPESRRFMKGIFAWVGFNTVVIEYTRVKRHAGKTKFSWIKLIGLSIEAVTSFSIVPLRVWSLIGLVTSIGAFSYGGFIFFKALVYGRDVPGYASLACIMLFSSGVQMIGLGIMGEYLGRTYFESKRRPPFIVRSLEQRDPTNAQ
jgi:glycosyltransferase involved in cell wall biosynthesis